MGTVIAEILSDQNLPFVIVDPIERQSETSESKYLFVTGDATRDAVLKRAGVNRAKGLITVVDSDVKNLYIVLTARSMNKELYIISKASQEEANSKLKWAGADKIVSPYTISGQSIANSITKPNVSDFLDSVLGNNEYNIEVEEVTITEKSEFAGKLIMDSNVRNMGIIIIAIKKKGGAFIYNPGPSEVIMPGDTLISLGRQQDFESLEKYL
jgi:voltage-gated potassium channel